MHPQEIVSPRVRKVLLTSFSFPQSQIQCHITEPCEDRFSVGYNATNFPKRLFVRSNLYLFEQSFQILF